MTAAGSFRNILLDETALFMIEYGVVSRDRLSLQTEKMPAGSEALNASPSTTNVMAYNRFSPKFESQASECQVRAACQMISPNLREFCTANLPGLKISNRMLIWLQQCIIELRRQKLNVYCIEPVLRKDLLEALLNKAAAFSKESSPAKDACPMSKTLGRLLLSFHGTRPQNIPSIVKHGFRVPDVSLDETGKVHQATRGSMFGRGIYSTPDVHIARQYGYDTNIILCAVTLGKFTYCTENDGMYLTPGPVPGFDSHVIRRKGEWVVFNTDQIIPLFVLHLRQPFVNQPPRVYVSSISESEIMDMTNPEKFRFKSFRN
jgi:hypothetical protein